eukprot:g1123.t1
MATKIFSFSSNGSEFKALVTPLKGGTISLCVCTSYSIFIDSSFSLSDKKHEDDLSIALLGSDSEREFFSFDFEISSAEFFVRKKMNANGAFKRILVYKLEKVVESSQYIDLIVHSAEQRKTAEEEAKVREDASKEEVAVLRRQVEDAKSLLKDAIKMQDEIRKELIQQFTVVLNEKREIIRFERLNNSQNNFDSDVEQSSEDEVCEENDNKSDSMLSPSLQSIESTLSTTQLEISATQPFRNNSKDREATLKEKPRKRRKKSYRTKSVKRNAATKSKIGSSQRSDNRKQKKMKRETSKIVDVPELNELDDLL